MRLCFHPGSCPLALLTLIVLCPIPRPVTSYAHSATADGPELESALLHLQAALDDPWSAASEAADDVEEEEALLRPQRGELMARPLSPFPGGQSVDGLHYPVGETEDGGMRNDALTSIAGGLQAVSREKGGFGFRFGRKRWTERGWKRGPEEDRGH